LTGHRLLRRELVMRSHLSDDLQELLLGDH